MSLEYFFINDIEGKLRQKVGYRLDGTEYLLING
jgi:hypothetical protein